MTTTTTDRFSLDTNILVYSVSKLEGSKHFQARDIVRRAARADFLLALQAIGEFYRSMMRKSLVSWADAVAQVDDWLGIFPCRAHSAAGLRFAIAAAEDRRASLWDAVLIATAAEGGCSTIMTEDMRHGATLGSVRIINPFGPTGLTDEALRLLQAPL